MLGSHQEQGLKIIRLGTVLSPEEGARQRQDVVEIVLHCEFHGYFGSLVLLVVFLVRLYCYANWLHSHSIESPLVEGDAGS